MLGALGTWTKAKRQNRLKMCPPIKAAALPARGRGLPSLLAFMCTGAHMRMDALRHNCAVLTGTR